MSHAGAGKVPPNADGVDAGHRCTIAGQPDAAQVKP